jgi:23S rRNA (uridine2552-2'-O)-methyltransferase
MPNKNFKVQDKYFKKAKEEGLRARSVFKLEAIQERFKLIRQGDKVLDVGAAPGSFLQLITELVGPKGLAVGVDLKPIEGFDKPNVITIVGDLFDPDLFQKIAQTSKCAFFDVITSDLAPATSGIKELDAGRSYELNEEMLKLARKLLKPGGHLVMKYFPGAQEKLLHEHAKALFKQVPVFRPPAVRETSKEVYIIGLNRRSDAL